MPNIDTSMQVLLVIVLTCLVIHNYLSFWREIIIASLMALIVLMAPVLNFIITSIISIIILLFSVSYFDNFIPFRGKIAGDLWIFLSNIGVINYFTTLYYKFFSQNNAWFYSQTFCIYSFCILYLWLSKYMLLNKHFISEINVLLLSMLYVGLIFGLLAFYLRSLLFTAIVIVDLQSIYKTIDVENNVPTETGSNKNASGATNKSLVSFHKHEQHNHNYETPKRVSFFKCAGFAVAFVGLGITGYAAYQQRLQTIAAQDSLKVAQDALKAQDVTNFEMTRQNDLEEVSQGLMSKEVYQQKYHKIK